MMKTCQASIKQSTQKGDTKVQDGETQVQAKKKTTKNLDYKGNKNISKIEIPLVARSISNNERTLSLENSHL
jgi:hypothetical protein